MIWKGSFIEEAETEKRENMPTNQIDSILADRRFEHLLSFSSGKVLVTAFMFEHYGNFCIQSPFDIMRLHATDSPTTIAS